MPLKEMEFPSVTICGKISNMIGDKTPKPYNEEELAKCNLTWQQYHEGQWVGSGTLDHCEDPFLLQAKVRN